MAKKLAKTPRRKVTAQTTCKAPQPPQGCHTILPARYAALLAHYDKLKPSLDSLIKIRQEAQRCIDKGLRLTSSQCMMLSESELRIHDEVVDMLAYMRKM